MRLSAHEDDVGHSPLAPLGKVFLDGKLLEGCFTADEERGEAFVYLFDAKGHIAHDGENALRERLTGNVRIVIDGEPDHG